MKTILIVDDDKKITIALMIRLRANGYKAVIAHDALAASTLARSLRPDLILLDISLPGGDGLRLAEGLNHLPEASCTPIIFMTASKNPNLLKKVMAVGAIGLFEKPFDTEKLLGSIDRELDGAELFNVGHSCGLAEPLEK